MYIWRYVYKPLKTRKIFIVDFYFILLAPSFIRLTFPFYVVSAWKAITRRQGPTFYLNRLDRLHLHFIMFTDCSRTWRLAINVLQRYLDFVNFGNSFIRNGYIYIIHILYYFIVSKFENLYPNRSKYYWLIMLFVERNGNINVKLDIIRPNLVECF